MISNKLKTLREEAGLTQTELAQQLQIGASTLRLYENGQRTPPLDVIVKICRFFSVTSDYLLALGGLREAIPVAVPDELRAASSNVMQAAASLCEVEGASSFDRSLLPIVEKILQILEDLVYETDARFIKLVEEFPEFAKSARPGALPDAIKLEVLSQVAGGNVDPELQKIVKAAKACEDDVSDYVGQASAKIGALITYGIRAELVEKYNKELPHGGSSGE